MKKSIFLLLMIFAFFSCYSQFISEKAAKIVAQNFFFNQANNFEEREFSEINISRKFDVKDNENNTLYYIFNIKNGGFIAVAGHMSSLPVLFYSLEGEYNPGIKNPAFYFWVKQYEKQIRSAISEKVLPDQSTISKWENLLTESPSSATVNREKAIPPLLVSQWNQDAYYNEMCPVDPNGPGGHAYAGCVATAMGQVMFYHKWPETGVGSYTYYHPVYDTISENFSTATYEWDGMLNKIIDSNPPIAQLLFHLGVSVNMDYGAGGSGMWNHSAAYSLRNHFKYCPETQYIFRDSSILNWDSILIANLDLKKPMYYAGWEDSSSYVSGHAFVCDGYQSPGFYHFNWGWGGSYDGFFYTDNLTPGGSQFTYAQEVIKDIYPDTSVYSYPENCSGLKISDRVAGTLNDGSYGADYRNNLDCTYLIAPECGNSFQAVFDRFELAEGDSVLLYDGQSDTCTSLGFYTYTDMPGLSFDANPTLFSPSSNLLFIRFKTDNQNTYSGWDISYESFFCQDNTFLTDTSGVIGDGSETCNYKNSASCKWTIQPPGAGAVYLNFTEFDLAPNSLDLVAVYKDAVTAGNLLAKYDYQNIPSSIIVPSGTVILWFRTSSAETANGWTCEYIGYADEIKELNHSQSYFSVSPNPSDDIMVLEFFLPENQEVIFTITDILGEQLGIYKADECKGHHKLNIMEVFHDLKPGIYNINLSGSDFSSSEKIILLSN